MKVQESHFQYFVICPDLFAGGVFAAFCMEYLVGLLADECPCPCLSEHLCSVSVHGEVARRLVNAYWVSEWEGQLRAKCPERAPVPSSSC